MDGLTAVQSRISEIQARFLTAPRPAASADWTAAATAAGLTGTGAATATAPGTAGSASEGAVVAEARKYLGVPYLWGGTDPAKGLDCSGFTKLVYGNLGVDLPRTSSQQATAGRPVANLAEARPGDLVFFDHSSSRPGIDHVGIYIGDGKMIAAPQAGDVIKVQDVGNPALIRRVLPDTAAAAGDAGSAGSTRRMTDGFPTSCTFTTSPACGAAIILPSPT